MTPCVSTPAVLRLSNETLGKIFEHVYFLSHKGRERRVRGHFLRDYTCWTTRPLWLLGGVCQKWRHVVRVGCPQLWANICTITNPRSTEIEPDPLSVLHQQLEFAKGSLLDITTQFDPHDKTSDFSILYEYRSRWQRAHIVVDYDDDSDLRLSEPIELDTMELQYLRLDLASFVYQEGQEEEDDEDEGFFPFNIIAPKLKQVGISGGLCGVPTPNIKLPWDQLTHVSLAFNDIRIILKYLLLLKNNVECLSALDVTNDDMYGYWPDSFPKPGPTTFPKLRALELRSGEDEPGELDALLDMLIAPSLRSVAIYGDDWPYDTELVSALERSGCQLENLTMGIDQCTEHLSAVLPHTPHLTSLRLKEVPNQDNLEKLCPSLERVGKLGRYDPYQTQIFHPIQSRLLWGADEAESGDDSNSDLDDEAD